MQTLSQALKPLLIAVIALTAGTAAADTDTAGPEDDTPTGRIAFVWGSWPWSDKDIAVMNADGTAQTSLATTGSNWAPSWSPDGRRIAFISDRDGNWEIYVMNADGSGQTRLTTEPADDTGPTWSPDGRRLAFASNRDGTSEIYVMNADGTDQTRLTSTGGWSPSWSPDGRRIAFTSGRDGNDEIYVMNADGTGQSRLTSAGGWSPSWSPDGSRIAFVMRRSIYYEENEQIYVMNADGTGRIQLTNEGGESPSWSPGGHRIAFMSGNHIHVMNADGTGRTQLEHSGVGYTPSWSPLGVDTPAEGAGEAASGRIAFVSDRDGNDEIYVMNADGTDQTRLTNNPESDSDPIWSPDGRRIAFRRQNRHLYVMNADGTGQTRIINGLGSHGEPAWSPDGHRIAFVASRDGRSGIYVINADGTGQTFLASAGRSPCWSPDGRQVMFLSWGGRNWDIYVMHADGTGKTHLASEYYSDRNSTPVWSPDCRRIAFVTVKSGWTTRREIYVINADATSRTRVASLSKDPSWSPDGHRIAFTASEGGSISGSESDIAVRDVDSRDRLGRSNTPLYNDSEPTWSPDGRRIAFTSDRDGNSEIYAMNAEGTGQARLTNNTANDHSPSWSVAADLDALADMDTPIPPDEPTYRIAFTSERDGNRDIYVINADGTGETRLTTDQLADAAPVWSPDGRRMAFVRGGAWTDAHTAVIAFSVYVMNADGSGQTELTGGMGHRGSPNWSPDGSGIAFAASDPYAQCPSCTHIYVMNADGTSQPRLVTGDVGWPDSSWVARLEVIEVSHVNPVWSPDGRRIAFTSSGFGESTVHLTNVDGTGLTEVNSGRGNSKDPSWSPDGRRIAVVSELLAHTWGDEAWSEIDVFNANGTGQTRLTSDSEWNDSPSWSLDGRRIAFTAVRNGNRDIYVINADGTGQTKLTDGPEDAWSPTWSPDSRRIAFTSGPYDNRNIYVINADGTGRTRLTTTGDNSNPRWSPVAVDDPAAEPVAPIVRIAAKRHGNGRIEFALQVRDGERWGERILPSARTITASGRRGHWLNTAAVDLEPGGPTVRIAAMRRDDGRIELALQVRGEDGWGERILPRGRSFPASGGRSNWLSSSSINLEAVADRDALIDLYSATDGPDSWTVKWPLEDPEIPISEWHGVALHRSGEFTGSVRYLNLSDNNLQGSLSGIVVPLSLLKGLEALNLQGNPWTGCVPSVLQPVLDLGRAIGDTPPDLASGLVSGVLNNSVFTTFAGTVAGLAFGDNAETGLGIALTGAQLADRMRKYDIGGLGLYPCVPFPPTAIASGFLPPTPQVIPPDEQDTDTDIDTLLSIRNYYVAVCMADSGDTRQECIAKGKFGSWTRDTVIEDWHGVDASDRLPDATGNESIVRVTRLSLDNRKLRGSIPPHLANLGRLRYLNLSQNQLSGSIPAHLGHLEHLRTLALNDNRLVSARADNRAPVPIPPEFGNLWRLEELYLQNNNLTGYLAPELNWLTASSLRVMDIDQGEIQGCLDPNSNFLRADVATAVADTAIVTVATFGGVSVSAVVPARVAQIAAKGASKVGPAIQKALQAAPTLAAKVATSKAAQTLAGNVGSMLVERALRSIEGPVGEGLSLFFSPAGQTGEFIGRLAEFVGWHGLGGALEMDAVYCQR